nr:phosphodiester glycosidase family protein [Propionibacterium sp.]
MSGRRLSRRALLGGAVGVVATGGAGTAWALDRFVIEHPEVTNASTQWQTDASAATKAAGTTATANSATPPSSGGTRVSVTKVVTGSGSSTVTSFVADLTLGAGTDLRAAFAADTFGQNVIANTSTIAKQNNARWAINGDYYGFRNTGIVIRNGAAFRDKGARQGLAVGRDGTLRLFDETATSAARLIADGVWHTLSFGPGIVENSSVIAGIDAIEIDTNIGNHSIQGLQPRTGIGMVAPNHLVAVVVDGRSPGYSRGVTMTEFAGIFVGLGAQVAYNLDGGGSSTMFFDGSVANKPLGTGRERGTSDILYVGN